MATVGHIAMHPYQKDSNPRPTQKEGSYTLDHCVCVCL